MPSIGEVIGSNTSGGKKTIGDVIGRSVSTGRLKAGDIIAGMRIVAAESRDPIHFNTHGPGVYDITEQEAVRKYGSMGKAAQVLADKEGMVVTVRRKGQRNIFSNHLHFADPVVADQKEVDRLRRQGALQRKMEAAEREAKPGFLARTAAGAERGIRRTGRKIVHDLTSTEGLPPGTPSPMEAGMQEFKPKFTGKQLKSLGEHVVLPSLEFIPQVLMTASQSPMVPGALPTTEAERKQGPRARRIADVLAQRPGGQALTPMLPESLAQMPKGMFESIRDIPQTWPEGEIGPAIGTILMAAGLGHGIKGGIGKALKRTPPTTLDAVLNPRNLDETNAAKFAERVQRRRQAYAPTPAPRPMGPGGQDVDIGPTLDIAGKAKKRAGRAPVSIAQPQKKASIDRSIKETTIILEAQRKRAQEAKARGDEHAYFEESTKAERTQRRLNSLKQRAGEQLVQKETEVSTQGSAYGITDEQVTARIRQKANEQGISYEEAYRIDEEMQIANDKRYKESLRTGDIVASDDNIPMYVYKNRRGDLMGWVWDGRENKWKNSKLETLPNTRKVDRAETSATNFDEFERDINAHRTEKEVLPDQPIKAEGGWRYLGIKRDASGAWFHAFKGPGGQKAFGARTGGEGIAWPADSPVPMDVRRAAEATWNKKLAESKAATTPAEAAVVTEKPPVAQEVTPRPSEAKSPEMKGKPGELLSLLEWNESVERGNAPAKAMNGKPGGEMYDIEGVAEGMKPFAIVPNFDRYLETIAKVADKVNVKIAQNSAGYDVITLTPKGTSKIVHNRMIKTWLENASGPETVTNARNLGELFGYHWDDINRYVYGKSGESAHRLITEIALSSGRPVLAVNVDAYGLTVPEGYVRQGDVYVKGATTPAKAAVVTEKPPVGREGTPQPVEAKSPEMMTRDGMVQYFVDNNEAKIKTLQAEQSALLAKAPDVGKGNLTRKTKHDSGGLRQRAKWNTTPDGKQSQFISQKIQKLRDMNNRVAAGEKASELTDAHKKLVNRALSSGKPVLAANVDAYGLTVPEGYMRQGDVYVKGKPTPPATTPAKAAVVTEKPPVVQEVTPRPSEAKSPEMMTAEEFFSLAASDPTLTNLEYNLKWTNKEGKELTLHAAKRKVWYDQRGKSYRNINPHGVVTYQALREGRSVLAANVDAYGLTVPEGYVRQGDVYVKGATTPAKAAVVGKKPTVGREVTPKPSEAKSPEMMTAEEFNSEYFYHGTGETRAEQIRKSGLQAGSYFTNNPDEAFGFRKQGKGSVNSPEARSAPIFGVQRSRIKSTMSADPNDPWGQEYLSRGLYIRAAEKLIPDFEITGAETINPHRALVRHAFSSGKPVLAANVDAYGLTVPEGYARQGDVYVTSKTIPKIDTSRRRVEDVDTTPQPSEAKPAAATTPVDEAAAAFGMDAEAFKAKAKAGDAAFIRGIDARLAKPKSEGGKHEWSAGKRGLLWKQLGVKNPNAPKGTAVDRIEREIVSFNEANPELAAEYKAAKAEVKQQIAEQGGIFKTLKGEEGSFDIDWTAKQFKDFYKIGEYHAKRLAYDAEAWSKAMIDELGEQGKMILDSLWRALQKAKAGTSGQRTRERIHNMNAAQFEGVEGLKEYLSEMVADPQLKAAMDAQGRKGLAPEEWAAINRNVGLSPEQLANLPRGTTIPSEAVRRAQDIIATQYHTMKEVADDPVRFVEEEAKLRAISTAMSGTASESGRTLAAWRNQGVVRDLIELSSDNPLDLFVSSRMTKPIPKVIKPKELFAENKIFTAERYEAAKDRLRAKASRMGSGVPADIIPDLVEMAGAWIEYGTREFGAALRREVREIFGDKLKLSNDDIKNIRDQVKSTTLTDPATAQRLKAKRAALARIRAAHKTFGQEMPDDIKKLIKSIPDSDTAAIAALEAEKGATLRRIALKRVKTKRAVTEQAKSELFNIEETDIAGIKAWIKKHNPPTGWDMTKRMLHEISGGLKALKASIDISAPGRQGRRFAVGEFGSWAKAWIPQMKALVSEKQFNAIQEKMKADPYYKKAVEFGVSITEAGGKPGDVLREEPFMSSIAEKIPGIRGSERAYVIFLNELRFNVFKKYAQTWEAKGTATPQKLEGLANMINDFTGRGTIKGQEGVITDLNVLMFSPRKLIGDVKSPFYILHPGKEVRKIAAKNLVAYAGAVTGAMALAKLAGADVEADPRSADFGKIRFGDMRIDLTGGDAGIIRYVVQFISKQKKDPRSGKIVPRKEENTIWYFTRSKSSPLVGLIWNFKTGQDFIGQDIYKAYREQPVRRAIEDFAPLIATDILDAYELEGPGAGLAASGLAGVGIGVQTYKTKKKKAKSNKYGGYGKPYGGSYGSSRYD